MTKNQKKELKCLRFFKLKNVDYKNYSSLLKKDFKYSKNGLSAEDAYFEWTVKGVKKETRDLSRLLELLGLQQWRMRTMAMWEDKKIILEVWEYENRSIWLRFMDEIRYYLKFV